MKLTSKELDLLFSDSNQRFVDLPYGIALEGETKELNPRQLKALAFFRASCQLLVKRGLISSAAVEGPDVWEINLEPDTEP